MNEEMMGGQGEAPVMDAAAQNAQMLQEIGQIVSENNAMIKEIGQMISQAMGGGGAPAGPEAGASGGEEEALRQEAMARLAAQQGA